MKREAHISLVYVQFTQDHIDWRVDGASGDFRSTFSIDEMQEFLSNNENEEHLRDLRDKMKKKLREEYDDDEEYEWEVEDMLNKSYDDIIYDINDPDELYSILSEMGLKEKMAEDYYKELYQNADVEDIVSEFCQKDDIECVMDWIEDYIDNDKIIDVLVDDADYYWLKDTYG